jgi:TRAP-type transport system small permease protein
MKLLRRLDRALAQVEAIAVGLVLAAMILASAGQWITRVLGFASSGDADVLVRFGVLWMAALGGALATQRRRHLAADVVLRFLPPSMAAWLRRLGEVLAGLASAAGAVLACSFVAEEWAIGRTQAGLPEAVLLSVLPLGFGLMSFHFLVGSAEP